MAKHLAPKQERFVAEYLVDLNATQAAIRAGYSDKTASSQGERLLRNVEIAKAVKVAQIRLAIRAERSAAEVLKDIQEVTIDARAAGDVRSALKGLELEGRHLGMFTDKVQHSGSVETVIEIRDRRNG